MMAEHPDYYIEDNDDVLPVQCPFCEGNEGHFTNYGNGRHTVTCNGCDQDVTDIMDAADDYEPDYEAMYEASLPSDPGGDVW